MVNIDLVSDTLREWWAFLQASGKETYFKVLKAQVYALASMVLFGVILAVVVLAFGYFFVPQKDLASNLASLTIVGFAVLGVMLLLVLAGLYVASVFCSLTYNIVDAAAGNREIDFWAQFRANLSPMFRWNVVWLVLMLVICSPYIIYLYFSLDSVIKTGNAELMRTGPLATMGTIASNLTKFVSWVFGFFMMFGIYELILGGKGVFASLGNSARMVWKNVIETFIFYIAFSVVSTIIAIPVAIVAVLAMFAIVPVAITLAAVPWLTWPAIIVGGLLLALVAIALVALFELVNVSLTLTFWRKLQGTPAPAKAVKAKRKS